MWRQGRGGVGVLTVSGGAGQIVVGCSHIGCAGHRDEVIFGIPGVL